MRILSILVILPLRQPPILHLLRVGLMVSWPRMLHPFGEPEGQDPAEVRQDLDEAVHRAVDHQAVGRTTIKEIPAIGDVVVHLAVRTLVVIVA